MADASRIDDLRRRVQQDPASIAFAQLAEECRRAGQFDEAVGVARAGLRLHPTYLSARVTLGRSLLELNRLDDAQRELEFVLESAGENLAATRALDEIRLRRSRAGQSGPVQPADQPAVLQQQRALRTIAALERWLLAIHVPRTDRHA